MREIIKETYFWSQLVKLCVQKGKSPNAVAKELSLSSGSVTSWKKGRVPHHSTLLKIADYFGVSVDSLLGNSDALPGRSASSKLIIGNTLTPHENSVIMAYRAHPEMQPAIDKLLGVHEDGAITVYTAAKSDGSVSDEYTGFDNEEFTAMKNEPRGEDIN